MDWTGWISSGARVGLCCFSKIIQRLTENATASWWAESAHRRVSRFWVQLMCTTCGAPNPNFLAMHSSASPSTSRYPHHGCHEKFISKTSSLREKKQKQRQPKKVHLRLVNPIDFG
eukprot:s690_g7.t1